MNLLQAASACHNSPDCCDCAPYLIVILVCVLWVHVVITCSFCINLLLFILHQPVLNLCVLQQTVMIVCMYVCVCCIITVFALISIMFRFSFIQYTNTWLNHKVIFITRDIDI